MGGAKHSRHMTGEAADIRPVSLLDLNAFKALIEQMIKSGELPELGGFGVYKNWTHVDCRPRKADGSIARWSGTGMGHEVG